MKPYLKSFWLLAFVFLAATALAQNPAYSSYYTYAVTYNSDGSATVTPTAEVTGIDDASDWIEGSYRPVCTVRPKIQLTGDADWVGGTRVALGHAVDQVRTGGGVYVPADGSTVNVQFSVEADVSCSRPPSPTYYAYPPASSLYTWSGIDPNYWLLIGFSPTQTNPPYYVQYCPAPFTCPVGYGVASILNFVDFADFLNELVGSATTNFIFTDMQASDCMYYLYCPNGNTAARCPDPYMRVPGPPENTCLNYAYEKKLIFDNKYCFPIGLAFLSTVAKNCN